MRKYLRFRSQSRQPHTSPSRASRAVPASPAVARRHQSAGGALPTVAVLTMTRDEGDMLHRWVQHYGDAVGRDNLLVLDDNSSDGSTTGLGCPVVPLPVLRGPEYQRIRMGMINGFGNGLLACHDFVIFVDVDEFLIPDPAKFTGLREYLAARGNRPVIAPVALNLVHHVGVEGDLVPDRPVLDQRSFAKFVPVMCKPSIKQVPARWMAATHGIHRQFALDPELFMLHLKFYDRNHLRATSTKRSDLVALDTRGAHSSWRRGRQLVQMLDQFVDAPDPDSVPEFDPHTVDLDAVVIRQGKWYRTRKQGQVEAMRHMPLVRVPRRLVGTL